MGVAATFLKSFSSSEAKLVQRNQFGLYSYIGIEGERKEEEDRKGRNCVTPDSLTDFYNNALQDDNNNINKQVLLGSD